MPISYVKFHRVHITASYGGRVTFQHGSVKPHNQHPHDEQEEKSGDNDGCCKSQFWLVASKKDENEWNAMMTGSDDEHRNVYNEGNNCGEENRNPLGPYCIRIELKVSTAAKPPTQNDIPITVTVIRTTMVTSGGQIAIDLDKHRKTITPESEFV
jgi:hypothetical protein